jgi:hypothetical protein
MNVSELIDAYETQQVECPPRRSIRTLRKGQVATIRSTTLFHVNELPLENHYRPMSLEQNATQATATSLPLPRPAMPTDLLPAATIVFQTQHGGQLVLVPVRGTVAPATTQISIATTSGAPPTPSPEPLPVPLRQGPSNPPLHPGADHLDSHPLAWHATSHRNEPTRLQKLWEDSRKLGEYHTAHGEFPADFQRARYSKAAFVARKLAALPTPPTTVLDFMTPYEVARRYDNLLEQYVHSARAALDEAMPAPQPQGDTVPNLPIPMKRAENVLTDNKDEGRTTTATPKDKGKGRDTQVVACEEAKGVDTELGDSEKENDPDHPGAGWMRYKVANPEHYVMWIPMPGEPGDTRAGYIQYVFNGKDTTLEGTFGKGHPVYRQPLRARRADTCPNLTDNKDIWDDHLSAFNPESTMAEIIDRYVHHMADPRLIAKVIHYHAQKSRQDTLAAHIKDLTEQQQRNNDVLMNTTRSLIHTKAATRLIEQMFAEPPSHKEPYKAYPFSICAGQGPANHP